MRGRNTTVISVRLPDKIVATLAERANRQDLSIGEYLRVQIIKGCSVNTSDSHSVNTMGSVNTIPVYNPFIHKPGDVVLVQKGKKWVESTVPMIDAEGNVYD